MARINVLTEEVVKKIAAGEVVDGPYSIVKELVENSIDAGAKRIDISIQEGGLSAIRVTDDGMGMDREDAVLAFKRHATSKIKEADDILGIMTLGFRGEALPSIAAVSKVTCISRPEGAQVGTKVSAEVEVVDLEEVGCPVGTTMEVRELFHDVPARKKFLKAPEKEFSRILDVVTSKALCHPEVMFKLSHNGKVVFHAPPAKDVLARIAAVYGVGISKEMLPVDWSDKGLSIGGYISKPHMTRSRNSAHIIVNDRDIVSRALNKALMEGYGPMVPKGRYPIAVLKMELSAIRVDVNVHPAKTEVRFEEAIKVERAVTEAVRKALSEGDLIPSVGSQDLEKAMPSGTKGISEGSGAVGHLQSTINVDTGAMEVSATKEVVRPSEGEDRRLPERISIKGQAGNCYIIGETREGVMIIDQHAAHEKVVFEELKRQFGTGRVQSQELLSPVTIELSAEEAEDLEGYLDDLTTLGFHVEPFGGRSCVVKHVPSVLGVTVEAGALHDLLADLSKGRRESKTLERIRDGVLATMACHTSTRGGDSLELQEMRNLVQLLYKADEPFNCPHGRPTIIFLPFNLLEKRFARRL
jgi:DNA mismatch repair protein MutL